jgi:ATP-dependent exoDNAse (exonuclease V) beta subunit
MHSEAEDCWWVIDYKTAHEDGVDPATFHALFAPQVEAYAKILRNLHGNSMTICAGLYYPRMSLLDSWKL